MPADNVSDHDSGTGGKSFANTGDQFLGNGCDGSCGGGIRSEMPHDQGMHGKTDD